uniref:Putative triabin-like lipocalin lipocalin lipocalin n=1 Tax=Panstrongylus lignarius TaxID=156445 RepID=A0A224XVL9_9HEMI
MNLTFLSLTIFILLGMINWSTSPRLEIQSRPELKQSNITQQLQKVRVGCPYMSPKQKFYAIKYYNGDWFLDRYYILNPRKNNIKSLCTRMSYLYHELVGGYQVISQYGVVLDEFGNDFSYKTVKTNYIMMSKSVGKFILCDMDSKENPEPNCHTEVTVLDTDYDNYSIEYICGREGSIESASIIKIFVHSSYILDDKVTTSLKKLGLKLEDFKISLDPIIPERKLCILPLYKQCKCC